MKAYIIGRAHINDEQKASSYMPLAREANEKFGGKYLARGGKFITKEGQEYQRNVIIEFPSFEKAKAAAIKRHNKQIQKANSIMKAQRNSFTRGKKRS